MSGNYGFVVDSSYDPFSLQEMLVPFTAYKEEYEKSEAAYQDLTDKADTFKYLSEKMPEGSKARQIYEGYANDLKDQAIDLAQNGYSMNNRRALTSMKRRYSGEIGRLVKADEAMETEKKLRQSLNAQDSSRLYAIDNLDIDQFLDGNNPNLYNISGNELYTRGAAAGKAASSRIFSAGDRGSTLNGYYRDYVQAMGYNADTIRKFREDMSAIPELQMEADAILQERGVLDNLTGVNLQRARQSVINGMIDGAVYNESHSPQRDLGVLSKAEKLQDERAKQQQAITMWQTGVKFDSNGNVVADEDNINYQSKKLAYDEANTQYDIMYPKDENGNRTLNPIYTLGKEGSPKIVKEDNDEKKSFTTALLQLKSKDLSHNEGFDVSANGDRKHYSYIAALSSHGRHQLIDSEGKVVKDNDGNPVYTSWYSGPLGKDNPGHWGWGFTSSSNVEDAWGNFSAEGSDSSNMRVLSQSEMANLLQDEGIYQTFENLKKQAEDAGKVINDWQIVEVPNEKDSNKKGYLIAVN
jgi:hypothetical protein